MKKVTDFTWRYAMNWQDMCSSTMRRGLLLSDIHRIINISNFKRVLNNVKYTSL